MSPKVLVQRVRLAGFCGVLASPLSLGLIFYAITLAPWFNWHTSALSDLGVYPLPSAPVFNGALVGGGLLTVVFCLGAWLWIGSTVVGRLGAALCMGGALSTILIGVFTEAYGDLHWWVAAAYFLMTPLGYTLLGVGLFRKGHREHGLRSSAAGLAALLSILFIPHDGLAVPELVAALFLSSQSFSLAMRLMLEGG
jgi:hypothetical membrane protein